MFLGDKVVSGSSDRTIRLWDIESGKTISTFTGHQGDIYLARMHHNVLFRYFVLKTKYLLSLVYWIGNLVEHQMVIFEFGI